MKTAIVTFQESVNSGALLQAFALQTILERLTNDDCDVLNHHCLYKESQYKSRFNGNWLAYINALLSKSIRTKKQMKADDFRNKYLNVTLEVYYSSKDMRILNDRYDRFIAGSDQVWNPINTGGDETYFLNFVEDSNKLVAYAPSIALDQLPSDFEDVFRKHLSRFKYLSVRERSGQRIIRQLSNREAELVLDPTLLLDKFEWEGLAQPVVDGRPYVFVYYRSYVPQLVEFARKLGQWTSLDIVVSVETMRDVIVCYKNGFLAKILSPEELVGGIAGARYVVTNSFHGVLFSVNFEKDFFVFGNNRQLSKLNARITDFLDLAGLQDRFVDSFSDWRERDVCARIDYCGVTKRIAELRHQSIDFIQRSLS